MLGTDINNSPLMGTLINNLDGNYTSAYQFDADNERGAINSMFIKNISFNQARGGTAILGGTANGNGLMLVKDASGSTVVQLDNTGITVTGGSISISNSGGTSIIDSSGLVSANNFGLGTLNNIASFDTTSSSFVSVTGGTMNSFVLDRASRVLLSLKILGRVSGVATSGNYATARVYDTNTNTTRIEMLFSGESSTDVQWDTGTGLVTSTTVWSINQTTGGSFCGNYSAGTHTLVLQVASGGGTAHLGDADISYLVLGS